MSKDSVLATLSQTADDQLATVFGELYSQLIQHLKSTAEDRSKSVCIVKRFLNLEWLPNEEFLAQLVRICSDLKVLYVTNTSTIDQQVGQTFSEFVSDAYCSVVGENCQVVSCIRDVFHKLGPRQYISVVQPIISDTMVILSATFKHCNDHIQFYGTATSVVNENIQNLFRLCNELLFECLDFVSNIKLDDNDDTDIRLLNTTLEAIFNMGTLISNLEVKTMAQLWKSFTSLLQKHSFIIRDHFNFCKAIRYFCTEIKEKIVTVYEMPNKNLTVTLKILNFLLKVVLRLCECSSGCLNASVTDLCQLISLLYQHSSTCAKYSGRNSEIATEIENSLLPVIDPLITILMKEEGFVEHFLELKSEETNASNVSKLLYLSMILQKIVLSSQESVYSISKLFEAVFQNISSCTAELHFDVRITVVPSGNLQLPQDIYLYDALVVHLASVIICTVSEENFYLIEKHMVTHLLCSSVPMKIFICDLWCVLARYGNSELCFEHVKLLVTLLRKIHCEKTETIVIKSLLTRLFKFLSRVQQQQFVSFAKGDWNTLAEVCHPSMKCTLSVFDSSFSMKVSERIQELKNQSSSIGSQDIDLLLMIQVAYKMGESNTMEQQIQEYIISFWHHLQVTQLCDSGLLHCVWPLIVVSKSCMLPHNTTFPVIEQFISSESIFLKLLVLDYLKSLGQRNADDIGPSKFISSVSSLFRKLLTDQNVLLRERALETFSYFSHVTVYEKIIQTTIAAEPEIAKRMANFLQNKVNPVDCEKTWDDFLKNILHRRRTEIVPDCHIPIENVEIDFGNYHSKRIKLDFDFDSEIIELETKIKSLSSNLRFFKLSPIQKDTLKQVLEIGDELRSYL